jgi:glyoxylase-like metal-dependent hydrolase (beta-lactamase superfamily II)
VKYILITHGHGDHIGALSEVKVSTGALVAIHPNDASKIPIEPDVLLEDGSFLTFGSLRLKVLHTPGHTPGGTCFLIEGYLFSGDTIFPGGPGNTSLPGANHSDIMKSISEKIFLLPDSTIIYPGHGLETTVGREKESGIYGSERS